MSNLFTAAATKAKVNKTKANDKVIVKVTGDDFDANLKAFAQLKKQFDQVKTKLTLVQGFVKDISLQKYYDLYSTKGSNPDSFIISSDSDASFMFAPTDNYIKIDDNTADMLKDKYGDDIVTEDTTFAFNGDILSKYFDVIGGLIQNCTDISDDDKANLIVATKNISIAKGSIDKAMTIGKGDVSTFLKDIQPIYQMKSPKTND